MNRKRFVGYAIIAAIALVWCVAATLVIYALATGDTRTQRLGELALDRVMSAERAQLDGLFRNYERDLRQEAAFLAAHDTLNDGDLRGRWKPLLESDWAVLAVGVANEHGDERKLVRGDSAWRFISSVSGAVNGPPLITEWSLNDGTMQRSRVHIEEDGDDPRGAIWFGQTMEDRGTSPTWTADSSQGASLLHLSVLLRNTSTPNAPYRILFFTLSSTRTLQGMATRSTSYIPFYLGADGRPFEPFDSTVTGRLFSSTWRTWNSSRTKLAFTVAHDGRTDMAQVIPYSLHGTVVHTGAVITTDVLHQWNTGERHALWLASAVLSAFAMLFVWGFVRTRRTDMRAQHQEKRSRTQERKLAKALGEREILDREVHHRVKNNLQVVSSLLNLQAQRIADPEARLEFTRGKRRIDSMALVHHKLYGQQDLRAIDLQLFLSQIANAVSAMFEPHSRTVSHSVDSGQIRADADTAIQLGIILCELLANCYQHAFPYATGGHIDIVVRAAAEGMFRMTVKDNGKGLERNETTRSTELGLEIVDALSEQIDGHATTSMDEGTRVEVTFRMQHPVTTAT